MTTSGFCHMASPVYQTLSLWPPIPSPSSVKLLMTSLLVQLSNLCSLTFACIHKAMTFQSLYLVFYSIRLHKLVLWAQSTTEDSRLFKIWMIMNSNKTNMKIKQDAIRHFWKCSAKRQCTYFDSKTFLCSHGQGSLLICGIFMDDEINLGHDQFKASIFQCLWKKQ